MKRVTEATLPEAVARLEAQPETAMFPLSNLQRHGLDGEHPHAPQMWMSDAGVLTICRNGTVMPNCILEAAIPVLKGRSVLGVIGPTDVCRPLINTLGLDKGQIELNADEPQYALDLNDLRVPDGRGTLCPLEQAEAAQMISWRTEYSIEALGRDAKAAAAAGRRDYQSYVANDSHRVLMEDGTPLSTTGFNAQLPEIVQIGGVYTPPEMRGRGLARRAVALHLQEARDKGARRATLFAANPAAQKAYEAIGFQRIGSWTLLMRKAPMTVGARS